MQGPARALWAKTTLHVWPESYRLVSLPRAALPDAAALVARAGDGFACLVLECDEVSVTIPEEVWTASPLRRSARQDAGPFKVITFNLDLDLAVTGYLSPAAEALAAAGVPIVPQCAFLKDHLLVPADRLETAVRALEQLIVLARASSSPEPRANRIEFAPDVFIVHLEDGRSLTVPLEWFPRLRDATPEQRSHHEMVGHGVAIHWPEIDEDISVRRLFGQPC